MDITAVSPSDVLTVGGASVIVTIIVQAVLSFLSLADTARKRFGPFIALATGIVTVGGFALVQHAPLDAAILVGILAGSGSIAVHDTAASAGLAI